MHAQAETETQTLTPMRRAQTHGCMHGRDRTQTLSTRVSATPAQTDVRIENPSGREERKEIKGREMPQLGSDTMIRDIEGENSMSLIMYHQPDPNDPL